MPGDVRWTTSRLLTNTIGGFVIAAVGAGMAWAFLSAALRWTNPHNFGDWALTGLAVVGGLAMAAAGLIAGVMGLRSLVRQRKRASSDDPPAQ